MLNKVSGNTRPDHANGDRDLCEKLLDAGWVPIHFPGGTTSIDDYLNWRDGKAGFQNVETCEGFGLVFRLEKTDSDLVSEINTFLLSEEFISALAKKFDIERSKVIPDIGIQKYLDGYEISPHPDIRVKALTFMVNINTGVNSEAADHHTHYMKFAKQWRYVEEFWRYNPEYDRAWVPWDWCETEKQQVQNNSIVIFRPSHDTMHAVRARYNHLEAQRTQLYGNLWFGSDMAVVFKRNLPQVPWQGLKIDDSRGAKMKMTQQKNILQKLISRLTR